VFFLILVLLEGKCYRQLKAGSYPLSSKLTP